MSKPKIAHPQKPAKPSPASASATPEPSTPAEQRHDRLVLDVGDSVRRVSATLAGITRLWELARYRAPDFQGVADDYAFEALTQLGAIAINLDGATETLQAAEMEAMREEVRRANAARAVRARANDASGAS